MAKPANQFGSGNFWADPVTLSAGVTNKVGKADCNSGARPKFSNLL